MKTIILLLLIYEIFALKHHHTHPNKVLGLKYNLTSSCFNGITCPDDEYVFAFVMDYYQNRGPCPEDFELYGHHPSNVVRDELDEDMCLDKTVRPNSRSCIEIHFQSCFSENSYETKSSLRLLWSWTSPFVSFNFEK